MFLLWKRKTVSSSPFTRKYSTYFMRKVIILVTLKAHFNILSNLPLDFFPAVFHLQHFIHSSAEMELTLDGMECSFCFILSLRVFPIYMQKQSCRGVNVYSFKLTPRSDFNYHFSLLGSLVKTSTLAALYMCLWDFS